MAAERFPLATNRAVIANRDRRRERADTILAVRTRVTDALTEKRRVAIEREGDHAVAVVVVVAVGKESETGSDDRRRVDIETEEVDGTETGITIAADTRDTETMTGINRNQGIDEVFAL